MPLPACICDVVGWIWQPVKNVVQAFLGTQAQGCLSHFSNWLAREWNIFTTPAVEELAWTSSIEGRVETLLEIKTHLSNDRVGIIGIYGMGGIGKTMLLQKINKDFCEYGTGGLFDLVIFVTVSREINIDKIQRQIGESPVVSPPDPEKERAKIHYIQRQIGERLGLSFLEVDSSPNQEKDQAKTLFKDLSKRRILLLIDDLWAKLDLARVGIPDPKDPKGPGRCKIAFTTRSEQVCTDMDADKFVRVEKLDKAQSWKLFCSKLRNPVDESSFNWGLAQQVVDKCGGLPLALITVGKAMANWKDHHDWNHAVNSLEHYAELLRGMDKVIYCLKFSFDHLRNDMKSALMYCAMYPDKDIKSEELVDYWVEEGLLDLKDGDAIGRARIDDARDRGHVLIRKLNEACMLEAGQNVVTVKMGGKNKATTVRLHDCVRGMLLYINRKGDDVPKFLVIDKENLNPLPANNQSWEHVRRVWMRDLLLQDESLCIPNCPNTWTLLLSSPFQETSLLTSFFTVMTNLRVLDLSCNKSLTELPFVIGSLQKLRYLNLTGTSISSLPIVLGNLGRLRQLLLEGTTKLCEIPRQAIVGLSSLQVLKMTCCGYDWDGHYRMTSGKVTVVEGNQQQCQPLELSDLNLLRQLQQLHIDLKSSQALNGILNSPLLCKSTRRLRLYKGIRDMTQDKLEMDLNHLSRLEELEIGGLSSEKVAVLFGTGDSRLRSLELWSCNPLNKLELRGVFPCLESIFVRQCRQMEELVLHGDFPNLTYLLISRLPLLKCIDRQPLTLPSLKTIIVGDCRHLSSLPLDTGSAPELKVIRGEQEWWDYLKWPPSNGSDMKSIFTPFFIPRL